MTDASPTVQEILVELAKELEDTRAERLGTEPDTVQEAVLSGKETTLREVLARFEDLDERYRDGYLPEWQIGLENDEGDWEWYYPHALTRRKALERAREQARDDLGDGPLNAYEVGGPLAA